MADNEVAYGFIGLVNLFSQRVSQVGVSVVQEAIQQSALEYSRVVTATMRLLATVDTVAKERYELPGAGTLQPLDEYGNPRPVRSAGYYDVAYPIQGGGTAWGGNRITNAMMTVVEANRNTVEAQRKDADWVIRHALAALMDESSWVFADPLLGNLTIEPLANGDTVEYVKVGGVVATDDHYLAQAAAIADATNPYPTIYAELVEHPGNSGPFVTYIPTELKATTMALTEFIDRPDPNIQYMDTNVLTSDGAAVRGFGDTVLGYVPSGRMWVVEWPRLPSTHMLSLALGAPPPLVMREYDAPQLRGFFAETHSPDGNRLENRMIRYAGFGCRNRVSAVVTKIGNASYATPTAYDAPLPI